MTIREKVLAFALPVATWIVVALVAGMLAGCALAVFGMWLSR